MVTTINAASRLPDIWKNFYDRVKSEVLSVSITGGHTITIKNYVSSFPDQLIDSRDNYPIIVVYDPEFSTEPLTNTKVTASATIEIEVYTNQSESASKFISQIINSIETFRKDLSSVGIRNIDVSDTSQDSATRGKIKLHSRTATFSFDNIYTKVGGF